MLINHKHKFIFLKTRKTAGTSIQMALARICGESDIITPLGEAESKKAEEGYPEAKNFRVPLSRVSGRELAAIPFRGLPKFDTHSPASYVASHISENIWKTYFKFSFERNPYDRLVSQYHWNSRAKDWNGMKNYLNKTTPYRRSNWSIYTINDQPAVDYIGHYETIQEDLEIIGKILDLPSKIELPQTKTGYRPRGSHYTEVIDDELRRMISIACAKEIALFGYGFEQSEPSIRIKAQGHPRLESLKL